MSEYKRLTKKDRLGKWYVKYANGDITLAPNRASQEVFNYLAKLENKIERGEFVELPCKAGDIFGVSISMSMQNLEEVLNHEIYVINKSTCRCRRRRSRRKQYQEEIERLNAENANLTARLEVAEQDKASLERTTQEVNETLSANGISIDCDGNVVDENRSQAVKVFAEELQKRIEILQVADDENDIFRYGFETMKEQIPDIIEKLLKESAVK
ncbi:MAG: hypothetical protein HDT32_04930 [Clostridiales bacterium]|nr:hypothetical protein [Clostridiales bacterium]